MKWEQQRISRHFRQRGEQYLLAIPSNTLVRDLESEALSITAGVRNRRHRLFESTGGAMLPLEAWTTIDVRDGEKGPLQIEIVKCRARARTDRSGADADETLVVIRSSDECGAVKHDYYLSNAPVKTELSEFARVAKAEHRIEECIERGKSETGLADYEVRCWPGWYHHQTLSLIAAWFILSETRRGKKMDTGDYLPTNPRRDCDAATRRSEMRWTHTRRANGPDDWNAINLHDSIITSDLTSWHHWLPSDDRFSGR